MVKGKTCFNYWIINDCTKMFMFHQSTVKPTSVYMIGARSKLFIKNAKPVPKARKPASDQSASNRSKSSQPVAEISDPAQSAPAPVPLPSPKAAVVPVQPVSHPSLLVSTLHRKSPECNFSDEDSEISGIDDLEKSKDEDDVTDDEPNDLNTAFTESTISPPRNIAQVLAQSRPLPTISAEIVRTVSTENEFLRRTPSGGIRATPKRVVTNKGKSNLVKKIEDIGEFKTKYKATERTKHLISKHGKEAAENLLLKFNNSKVDGLDEKENGFILIYKSGEKSFIVSEGHMGRRMVESEEYRKEMFENSKKVEVNLKTQMLT